MKTVTDILKEGFRVSVELVPSMIDREGHPSLGTVLSVLDDVVKPSFISVTQGASGTSREQSPFLLSRLSADRDLCAHLICGYAPRVEVLRHAANFYASGIRTFLVLLGDAPAANGGGESQPDLDTYLRAVDCVRDLRAKYPDLCIGVAAYPDASSYEERITYLRAKHEAGADFAITQMVFNADTYASFINELGLPAFPVLPGTCFIHSADHASQFAKRFGVRIPWPLPRPSELIASFRDAGAPGVHFFVLNDLELTRTAF